MSQYHKVEKVVMEHIAGAGSSSIKDMIAEAERIAKERVAKISKPTTYPELGKLGEYIHSKPVSFHKDISFNPRQIAYIETYIDKEHSPFNRPAYERKKYAEEKEDFLNTIVRRHNLHRKLMSIK